MGSTCNEWFSVLALCLTFIFCQTMSSKGAELFDLSELSASQQNKLWTQVDNWAVAVALANFCKRPISLEEQMLRIASKVLQRHIIRSPHATALPRIHWAALMRFFPAG